LTDTTPITTYNAVATQGTGDVILATFTDVNPNAALSDFTLAPPNWGGTVTSASASIQFVSSANGVSTWNVVGHATYASAGTYTVSVNVKDVGGSTVSTTNTTFNVTLAGFLPTNPDQLFISAPNSNGFFQLTANGQNLSVFTGSAPGATHTSLDTFTLSASNQVLVQPTVANATLEIDGGATDSINIASSAAGTVNGTPVSFADISNLNVNGNVVLGTAGNTLTGFGTLKVSGSATIESDVTTTSAQEFDGAVALNADATLNAGSGNITFKGAVTGNQVLTVDSTGAIKFLAPVFLTASWSVSNRPCALTCAAPNRGQGLRLKMCRPAPARHSSRWQPGYNRITRSAFQVDGIRTRLKSRPS
jgi:hypothetical protein